MTMNAEQFVEKLYEEDPMLQKVLNGIRKAGMPEISIAPGYGRLLTLLARMNGARRILEIGALGGYSGICLARALPEDGTLTSLEINADFAALAQSHLQQAGLGDRVEYRIGDASESLKHLQKDGRTFDFFFIDADKANYPVYLDFALQLGTPGAVIVGDNMLMHGKTMDEQEQGEGVRGMREFIRRITGDERLHSVVLPANDGLAIARIAR